MQKHTIVRVVLVILVMMMSALTSPIFGQSTASEKAARILFRASGQVTIEAHLHGHQRYTELGPGYRSDLMVNMDIMQVKGVILNFLTVATTSIARLPETPIKLDKIRYTLAPELRYPMKKLMLTGLLSHECIHTISREETDGSIWWNILRLGAGTKGAYHFYLMQKYRSRDESLRNSFDFQLNAGCYLRGKSIWLGKNHDYRYEFSGLMRYHVGLFRNFALYFDVRPQGWVDTENRLTGSLALEANWVILADNIASVYYKYFLYDENPHDNQHSLGALGIKMAF